MSSTYHLFCSNSPFFQLPFLVSVKIYLILCCLSMRENCWLPLILLSNNFIYSGLQNTLFLRTSLLALSKSIFCFIGPLSPKLSTFLSHASKSTATFESLLTDFWKNQMFLITFPLFFPICFFPTSTRKSNQHEFVVYRPD